MKNFTAILVTASLFYIASFADGHGVGRLFDISVINGKLVAQGYNTGGADGLDFIRPHANAIHDHFNFIGTELEPVGITDYPSWDVGILEGSDIAPLVGYELTIELIGSGKWVNVPAQDGSGTAQDFGTPELVTFSSADLENNPAEIIRIRYDGNFIDTLRLGELKLLANVNGITPDLDFKYFIDNHNPTEIYFLEFRLKTNAPGIENSESVFVIQSPDGVGAVERLHFQSLYLETFLGTNLNTKLVLGDVNRDGQADLLDVQPFVLLINTGAFQAEADTNQDGIVDLLDVNPLVTLLNGN
ncbi:MAG: hypothetical protein AAGA30_06415 [Planctomycetota bacterium]